MRNLTSKDDSFSLIVTLNSCGGRFYKMESLRYLLLLAITGVTLAVTYQPNQRISAKSRNHFKYFVVRKLDSLFFRMSRVQRLNSLWNKYRAALPKSLTSNLAECRVLWDDEKLQMPTFRIRIECGSQRSLSWRVSSCGSNRMGESIWDWISVQWLVN